MKAGVGGQSQAHPAGTQGAWPDVGGQGGRAGPGLRSSSREAAWARGQRPGSGLHNPSLAAPGTDVLHNCSVFVQTNDDLHLSLN